MQVLIVIFKLAKGLFSLRIMQSDNNELDFASSEENPSNDTKYIQVALNLQSREVVLVKTINPRGGDPGLPLPHITDNEIEKGDMYSVYAVELLEKDKPKRGFLYVKEEKE